MMKRVSILCVLFFTAGLAGTRAAAWEVWVGPEGTPGGKGTRASPVTFGEALRRAGERLEAQGAPEGGITIRVQGGRYSFHRPFVLGPEFKGTAERPILIRAEEGAEVRFDGSLGIDPGSFRPVTDPEERARLAAAAADRIRAAVIDDPVLLARFNGKVMLNLSFDGRDYLPSVFPNEGYAHLAAETVTPEVCPPGVPVGKEAYGIRAGHPPHREPGKPQGWKGTMEEPRGARVRIADGEGRMAGTWLQWERELARNPGRALLTGYIEANWLLSSQPIHSADAKERCFRLPRVLGYGWAWRKDKPFRVFGLLCELDRPGEWHFDPRSRRLYLYPPEEITPGTRIGLSVAPGFLRLEDTAYVRVLGLHVTNVGGGTVFEIAGGHHNLIAACTVRNCTARGIAVTGTGNAVKGCDLVDLDAHVYLGGGVRSPSEITPGRNLVENCHIYQKDYRHRRVDIAVTGVGNTFRHNLVHNSIGQPMRVQGNDHLVELNEFFNVGFDEGDGGAVYSGADLAGYGNLYRYNFVHHLICVPGKVPRHGFHFDDLQAGSTCIGNVFYKAAHKAIFYNGGAGHTARDNVFLEGYLGIYNTGGGAKRNYERQEAIFRDPNHMYRNTKENYVGRVEKITGKEGWTRAPWKEKYPLFFEVMSDTGPWGRLAPIRCRVEHNFYHGNRKGDRTVFDRCAPEVMAKNVIRDDRTVRPEDFVDYERLDLRFKEPGKRGFSAIPFERIGLKLDRYRKAMPDKQHYRSAVKAFFEGIPSYPGSHRKMDTARVVEEGPLVRAAEAGGDPARAGEAGCKEQADGAAGAVLPVPKDMRVPKGRAFAFGPDTGIYYKDPAFAGPARVLAHELQGLTGEKPAVRKGTPPRRGPPAVVLRKAAGAPEAYRLSVQASRIVLEGRDVTALAHARATLLFLVREKEGRFEVPACTVHDRPDETYRGVMVDCARRYQPPYLLEQVIELCSLYKVPFLHLHLSDDQSFTFPSRDFPKAPEVSPWKYTREELARLVAFAADRGVVLVPEIDMPGHSSALLRAYPEWGDGGVLNACDEETYTRLEKLWADVAEVFHTSPYLHMGGDEVNFAALEKAPGYKTFLRAHRLSGPLEAYHYFIARVTGILRKLGRTPVVWEGFRGTGAFGREGRVEKDVLVMAWSTAYNHPAVIAAGGYRIVNASWKPLYIVGGGRKRLPHVSQAMWPPEAIYRWNKGNWQHREPGRPSFKEGGWNAPPEVAAKVVGGQLCLWEQGEKHLLEDLLPRLAAFTERLHDGSAGRPWPEILRRYRAGEARAWTLVRPVRILPDDPRPEETTAYDHRRFRGRFTLRLENRSRWKGTIRYTLDGSLPGPEAPAYEGPVPLERDVEVRAVLFDAAGRMLGGPNLQSYSGRRMHVHYARYAMPLARPDTMPSFRDTTPVATGLMPSIRGPYLLPGPVGRVLEATLRAERAGTYAFTVHAPGGLVDVYLDGRKVFSRRPDRKKSPWRKDAFEVELAAGRHALRVVHVTGPVFPTLILTCRPPGVEKPIDLDREAEALLEPLDDPLDRPVPADRFWRPKSPGSGRGSG